MNKCFAISLVFILSGCSNQPQGTPNQNEEHEMRSNGFDVNESVNLTPWSRGELDVHFINTGRGDAAFMVFPDGTTALFDAGSVDESVVVRHPPLKLADPMPNDLKRPGEWIVNYLKQVLPEGKTHIDYGLISHFHSDHYGFYSESLPASKRGNWKLTGITDVAETFPIRHLIDRAYPDYDSQAKTISDQDYSFKNFQAFVKAETSSGTMKVEALRPGVSSQITLLDDPDEFPRFKVTNVAANGVVWTGLGEQTQNLMAGFELTPPKGVFNENPLSLAIKVSYGEFDFYTGGDITGSQVLGEPAWFDVETSIGEAIGETDIVALNHHGNRDATNGKFLQDVTPRVLVQQSWISDHPGGEVVHRMTSKTLWQGERDIFATNMLEETKVAIGPWLTKNYKSMQGHIVIRVAPGGGSYRVMILDDSQADLRVKDEFGPYESR